MEEIGVAPKKMSNLVRAQKALGCLRGGEADAAVASTCGYVDQAHMIREVRAFAGVTPGDVRRRLGQPLARSFNRDDLSHFYNTVYLQSA